MGHGILYIYIYTSVSIYIYSVKSKPPKLDDFRSLKRLFFRPCGSAWLLRCEVSFQMSPDYTGSPFYPQEKNFVGGIYIYIYVYVGLYMCIWGL